MRYVTFLALLIFLVPLAACGERSGVSPTPFPTTGPQATTMGNAPVSLTVTELMAAPGLYRDAVVQLTGRLRKQPLIVCDSDLRPSPAGWGLAEEGVLALAGGFDQQVRSLLPDDLTMSVEGRWRLWEGLVGCGKRATQQEVWYLEVGRILSPSPITQVTVTPGGEIAISSIADTPASETAAPTEPETLPSPNPQETPGAPEPTEVLGGYPGAIEETPATGAPTPSGQATLSTPGIGTSPAATPGLTTTPTPSGTAATPAATSSTPGTPTTTPSGTTPTPTNGAPGQIAERGDLYEELIGDFLVTSLAARTTDRWEMDVFADEPLFINVVAPAPADIVVSFLKDGQPIINRQNTAPAGSTESISDPALSGDGIYEIQISTNGGEATDYAITVYTGLDSPIVFPGTITSGTPRTAIQMQEFAYHYWFFVGHTGDDVTIRLTPLNNGDGALSLYGPDGEDIDYIDDGAEGETETLVATLEANGLFAIAVEEIYGDAFSYNLELTIQ